MSRLRSQYVTVQLAQIGGLPAVVESEDDGQVLLSLATKVPPGLDRVLDRPVRIGLTAGASTPNNKIGETVARILATRGLVLATV